jgi:hypothetical protein
VSLQYRQGHQAAALYVRRSQMRFLSRCAKQYLSKVSSLPNGDAPGRAPGYVLLEQPAGERIFPRNPNPRWGKWRDDHWIGK